MDARINAMWDRHMTRIDKAVDDADAALLGVNEAETKRHQRAWTQWRTATSFARGFYFALALMHRERQLAARKEA